MFLIYIGFFLSAHIEKYVKSEQLSIWHFKNKKQLRIVRKNIWKRQFYYNAINNLGFALFGRLTRSTKN
jgi:hypothetical protein